MRFHLGDRVEVCNADSYGSPLTDGMTGTICCEPDGVCFDRPKKVLHDCDDHCINHHGWFVPLNCLQPLDERIPETAQIDINDLI